MRTARSTKIFPHAMNATGNCLGKIYLIAFLFLVFAACSGTGRAADWPMWRCDAGRTGSTEEELRAELHLQWVRQYPELQPMWSGCRDLSNRGDRHVVGFEVVYSPIVLGTTMFVGSSVNDSLTAIDVETGKEKWMFYTEGPVRLAPAGWKNPSTGSGQARVYVTSDDGFLYCLNAADGKLVWKFRGAPMKHRIIGDERLVSTWPARGGPVVADGVVYITAGIWPFMGIYIYALDAETGKKIWVNDQRGSKWNERTETTAPQGPLAIIGDKLLIPNARLGTTCLDRETGKFLYCTQDRSLWKICGAGKYFITSAKKVGAQLRDLETGLKLGNLADVPVLSGETLYWATGSGKKAAVGGSDLTKTESAPEKGTPAVKIPELWRLDGVALGARENLRIMLRAGSRLYAASGNSVVVVDMPAGERKAKVSWTGAVEGRIGEMFAAAGRLFVVTHEGGIYCFGAEKTEPVTHTVVRKEMPSASDVWTEKAGKILKSTGVGNGYALVLGIGSGRLVEELLAQSELRVIGIDPDAGKVDALRRRLDKAGLYGERATVFTGVPTDCGLPPYLANLIVSEDPKAAGIDRGPAFARAIFRSLRPYGGVALLPASRVSLSVLKEWVKSAGLENAEVGQSAGFASLSRIGSLPGSAPWTHQDADAGNTESSRDDLVRAPLGLLWFGGPSTTLSFDRHFKAPRPHVVGGRIIVLGPEGLTAVDVYTGRILWHAKDPEVLVMGDSYRALRQGAKIGGSYVRGSNYASLSDGIYAAGGSTCVRLDPATGKRVSEIKLPSDGGAKTFGPIRIWEDVLVAAADPIATDKAHIFDKGRVNRGASSSLIAFDRNSGNVLWSLKADQGFSHNGIAVGQGKVFCIDRWSKTPMAEITGGRLIAIDVRTGKTVWRVEENVFGAWLSYSSELDIVLQSTGIPGGKGPHRSRGIAYRGADGKVLWDKKIGSGPWMVNGIMLVTQAPAAFDLRSGEKGKELTKRYHRCGYYIGNAHVITARSGSAAYVDLHTDTEYRLGGFRSSCLNTLIPADGVLSYTFSARHCTCSYNIRASVTLVHMPELAGEK